MRDRYTVTIYNQATCTSFYAYGRTRPEAFKAAIRDAGEAWLREGGDKLTTLRVLFYDHLMRHYRTSSNAYASDPNGAGVEFRRLPNA